MSSLHAVILAGGSGTRFWPASRNHRPKQLLPLASGTAGAEPKSLLRATADRLAGLLEPDRIWVVTNPIQAAGVSAQLPELPRDHVLVEPQARDTAPCIALATACIAARCPDATIAFMPADHRIEPVAVFHALLRRGEALAQHEQLVTFGLAPTFPATGYGYIEIGKPIDDRAPKAYAVAQFREKPSLATAQEYLASGRFLWNSGIFVWRPSTLLTAMAAAEPQLHRSTLAMQSAFECNDGKALERAFLTAPKTSIDYAVMEKARNVVVVRAELTWDDLGAFTALGAVFPKDADGNVLALHGGATAICEQSRNCITYAQGARTVALFGVEDLVVVAVDDAIMVCPRNRAEDLKQLIARVKAAGRDDLL